MANTAMLQVRMDADLKKEAEELFEKMGTSLPDAVRIFARTSVNMQALPFEMSLKKDTSREEFRKAFYALREEATELPEMTLDEINEEIKAARKERKRRQTQ